MMPTEFLAKQHRKVEQLFEKLEKAKSTSSLVTELANELAAHMTIEQEIFYPALKAAAPDLILESLEEHAIAEIALKRLLHTEGDDETFHARVKSLKDLIKHHVSEEEEQLFPQADEALEEGEAAALLSRMKERFAEALEEGYETLLPKSPSKTSADKKPKRSSMRPQAH